MGVLREAYGAETVVEELAEDEEEVDNELIETDLLRIRQTITQTPDKRLDTEIPDKSRIDNFDGDNDDVDGKNDREIFVFQTIFDKISELLLRERAETNATTKGLTKATTATTESILLPTTTVPTTKTKTTTSSLAEEERVVIVSLRSPFDFSPTDLVVLKNRIESQTGLQAELFSNASALVLLAQLNMFNNSIFIDAKVKNNGAVSSNFFQNKISHDSFDGDGDEKEDIGPISLTVNEEIKDFIVDLGYFKLSTHEPSLVELLLGADNESHGPSVTTKETSKEAFMDSMKKEMLNLGSDTEEEKDPAASADESVAADDDDDKALAGDKGGTTDKIIAGTTRETESQAALGEEEVEDGLEGGEGVGPEDATPDNINNSQKDPDAHSSEKSNDKQQPGVDTRVDEPFDKITISAPPSNIIQDADGITLGENTATTDTDTEDASRQDVEQLGRRPLVETSSRPPANKNDDSTPVKPLNESDRGDLKVAAGNKEAGEEGEGEEGQDGEERKEAEGLAAAGDTQDGLTAEKVESTNTNNEGSEITTNDETVEVVEEVVDGEHTNGSVQVSVTDPGLTISPPSPPGGSDNIQPTKAEDDTKDLNVESSNGNNRETIEVDNSAIHSDEDVEATTTTASIQTTANTDTTIKGAIEAKNDAASEGVTNEQRPGLKKPDKNIANDSENFEDTAPHLSRPADKKVNNANTADKLANGPDYPSSGLDTDTGNDINEDKEVGDGSSDDGYEDSSGSDFEAVTNLSDKPNTTSAPGDEPTNQESVDNDLETKSTTQVSINTSKEDSKSREKEDVKISINNDSINDASGINDPENEVQKTDESLNEITETDSEEKAEQSAFPGNGSASQASSLADSNKPINKEGIDDEGDITITYDTDGNSEHSAYDSDGQDEVFNDDISDDYDYYDNINDNMEDNIEDTAASPPQPQPPSSISTARPFNIATSPTIPTSNRPQSSSTKNIINTLARLFVQTLGLTIRIKNAIDANSAGGNVLEIVSRRDPQVHQPPGGEDIRLPNIIKVYLVINVKFSFSKVVMSMILSVSVMIILLFS